MSEVETKSEKVAVRISPTLKRRLESALRATGITESTIVIQLLEAFCDYVEFEGQVAFPIVVKPKRLELTHQARLRQFNKQLLAEGYRNTEIIPGVRLAPEEQMKAEAIAAMVGGPGDFPADWAPSGVEPPPVRRNDVALAAEEGKGVMPFKSPKSKASPREE